jgi:acyl-CoA thioesterase YciA
MNQQPPTPSKADDHQYLPPELEHQLENFQDEPLVRVVMMPKHTNALGTIFGGVILSHLDIAASEQAMKTAGCRVVTKVLKQVDFVAAVNVGDWVSFYTRTESVGETSVTVRVLVVAQRGVRRDKRIKVTEAEAVFVAVDDDGKPTKVQLAE